MALTEAEELELLELEEEEARAKLAAKRAEEERVGAFGAIGTGLEQGITLGLRQQLAGVGGMLGELYQRATGADGRPNIPLSVARQVQVERAQAELEQAERAFPKTTAAAEIAGGFAAPIPGLGEAVAAARALPVAGRIAAPLVRYAVPGAIAGAASGFGRRGEVSDIPEAMATGAVASAVLGPAVSRVAEATVPKAQAVANLLAKKAEERALKTMMIQKDIQKIAPEKQLPMGRAMLELGVIRPFRTAEQLAPGIEAAGERVGEDIGQLLTRADLELAKRQGLQEGSVREVRKAIADRVAADREQVRVAAEAQRAAARTNEAGIREQVAELEAAKETLTAKLQNTVKVAEGKRRSGLGEVERENIATGAIPAEEAAKVPFPPAAVPEVGAIKNRPAAQQAKEVDQLATKMLASADPRVEATGPAGIYAGRLTAQPVAEYPAGVRAAFAAEGKARDKAVASLAQGGTIDPPEPRSISELRQGVGIDLAEAARRIREQVLPKYQAPGLESAARQVSKLADAYEREAARGINIEEANRFKSKLDKTVTKWYVPQGAKQTVLNEARKDVRNVLRDFVDENALAQLPQEQAKTYLQRKQQYEAVMRFLEATPSAMARDLGNQYFGLGEKLTGIQAGQVAEGVLGSALTAPAMLGAQAVRRQLRTRGPSTLAYYGDVVSKYLAKKYGQDVADRSVSGTAAAAAEYFRLSQQDAQFRAEEEQRKKAAPPATSAQ
jgi:hypothetical protein